jgi:hypothetical protein
MSMSEHAYDQAWKRYRRLRLHFFLAIASFVLSGVAAAFAARPSWAVFVVLAPVVGSSLYCTVAFKRLSRFPCPRCGLRFTNSWRGNKFIFAKACLHCDLPLFAPTDPKARLR